MWYQLLKASLLLFFTVGFLYGIILITKHILSIPPYLQKPDDPNVLTLLIVSGLLGFIGVVLMIVANTIPQYALPIWAVGVGVFIVLFWLMFYFGRLLRRPNNPSQPLSLWNVGTGLFASFLPFLLLIVAGNQIFQEVLDTDENTLLNPFLKIIVLGIPAVVGLYGSGMFGKMSP
jgi:hypothetical protein